MSSRRRRVRQPTSNNVMCECGRPAVVRKSLSASNPDRKFFCCAKRGSRKEEEEKGCDLFEWKDVRMATEKEKQRADAVVASLKMENVRLKAENCALKEDNNELRESVAQLLQGSGGSGNCKCHEQHCCCSAAKVEWDGVEARLTLLESILLAKD
ncbi:unnamed protein product [Linum tenue]|uniref:GRF-type domain-containing protein n=1 Tax=Linum tenue TaxID=586396 RepID=A0AAV0QT07_9ROSI|nr:unnamed protein product [Linum tenue]